MGSTATGDGRGRGFVGKHDCAGRGRWQSNTLRFSAALSLIGYLFKRHHEDLETIVRFFFLARCSLVDRRIPNAVVINTEIQYFGHDE